MMLMHKCTVSTTHMPPPKPQTNKSQCRLRLLLLCFLEGFLCFLCFFSLLLLRLCLRFLLLLLVRRRRRRLSLLLSEPLSLLLSPLLVVLALLPLS